jgi:hypothetical protein
MKYIQNITAAHSKTRDAFIFPMRAKRKTHSHVKTLQSKFLTITKLSLETLFAHISYALPKTIKAHTVRHTKVNPLKSKRERERERERDRKDGRRVEIKRKHLMQSERRFISERGRKSILLEGTQAMPARPCDKDRMGVKTLGWWVVEA